MCVFVVTQQGKSQTSTTKKRTGRNKRIRDKKPYDRKPSLSLEDETDEEKRLRRSSNRLRGRSPELYGLGCETKKKVESRVVKYPKKITNKENHVSNKPRYRIEEISINTSCDIRQIAYYLVEKLPMVSSAIEFIDTDPYERKKAPSSEYLRELIERKYDTSSSKVYICFYEDEAIGITCERVGSHRVAKTVSTVKKNHNNTSECESVADGENNISTDDYKVFWNSRLADAAQDEERHTVNFPDLTNDILLSNYIESQDARLRNLELKTSEYCDENTRLLSELKATLEENNRLREYIEEKKQLWKSSMMVSSQKIGFSQSTTISLCNSLSTSQLRTEARRWGIPIPSNLNNSEKEKNSLKKKIKSSIQKSYENNKTNPNANVQEKEKLGEYQTISKNNDVKRSEEGCSKLHTAILYETL